MPAVRTFQDRVEKYQLKYPDAATQTARLTAVRDIMLLRFEAGSAPVADAIDTVRNIVESAGVPSGQHGVYYAFAQKLVKLMFSHSGLTLQYEVAGLKKYFATGLGADPRILDQIITAFLGSVPPY